MQHTIAFLVDERRNFKSSNKSYYIIPTDSILQYEPVIFLTGSHGNEYKLSFTIDSISRTCADFKLSSSRVPLKLCKHILFILKQINFVVSCGINYFRPDEVLSNLETYSLSNHFLNKRTTDLCRSHRVAKYFYCKK